jgi:hypothetical protein
LITPSVSILKGERKKGETNEGKNKKMRKSQKNSQHQDETGIKPPERDNE